MSALPPNVEAASERSETPSAPEDEAITPSTRAEVARLWSLGWPASLGLLCLVLMGATDNILVGSLGSDAVATVGLGNLWCFGIAILGHAGIRAIDPIVAQAFGAGDRVAAGRGLVRGWALALCLALPLMLLHPFAAEGLGALGQPKALLPGAEGYAWFRMWGLPFAFAYDATRQFLQGLGDMKRPMRIALAMVPLNALLDLWFIHGGLGVPAMGTNGTGLATALCVTLGFFLLLGTSRDALRPFWPGLSVALEWRPVVALLPTALAAGFQSGLEVWAFNAAGIFMGWFGEDALAAHVIALSLASVSFSLPFGMGAAAATRVGNLLGAGLPWERSAWLATGLGIALMVPSSVLFVVMPQHLIGLYNATPALLVLGAQLLPIASMFQVFDGFQVVVFGALRGAGDVRVPMLANVLGYWMIGLPVGVWLAFPGGHGPLGVWYGLVLALVCVSALLAVRLRWTAAQGGFRVEGA